MLSRNKLLLNYPKFVVLGAVLVLAALFALIPTHKTYAARTTTANICQRSVSIAGSGTLPNGHKYVSFEYDVVGNDNARAFMDSSGNLATEPGWLEDSAVGNCTDVFVSGLFWDGTHVDFKNPFYQQVYQGLFPNYTNVKDIYWGGPAGSNYGVGNDYCSDPNIGWADAPYGLRGAYGIDSCRNGTLPFALVNDAGFAMINGQRAWCLGFDIGFYGGNPTCRGMNSAMVYPGGGDFAGYQNITNGNALANTAQPYRNYIQSQSPITPTTGTSFDLRIGGFNTRDAVPPWFDTTICANWPPGQGSCDWWGRSLVDPNINIKAGVIFTVELEPTDGPYTVQGYRVYGPGNTQMPANCSQTLQDGIGNSANPYFFVNLFGSHTYSATNSIICGGIQYDLVGSSLCTNGSNCTGQQGIVSRTLTGSPGITYDLWFYYKQVEPLPACDPNVNAVPSPEPGQPFALNIQPKAASQVLSDTAFRIDVSSPPIFNGLFGTGTIPAFSNSSTTLTQIISGVPIGNYTINYRITFTAYSGKTTQCQGLVIVAAKPFFSVRNGDIASGFTTGSSSCTNGWAANDGRLAGWSPGAGTNLAILALTVIEEVSSAQSGSSPPNGLSFANDGAGTGNYGGKYGGTIDCPKDYYSKYTGGSLTNASSLPDTSTDYQVPGPFTLNGGSLSPGNRVALYVNGNVRITNNITLANGSGIGGLSNFYLVATGNIYIDPGVTELDGVYIAQGNGATGQIYTCSNGFAPPTAAMVATVGGACNQPLTIKGAFIADKVNLYRSFGTLSANNPAEVFQYTPNVWLAPPASIGQLFNGGGTQPTNGGYDAITNLPPVL